MENGHLEPWDFGHPGWANERLSAHITVAGTGSRWSPRCSPGRLGRRAASGAVSCRWFRRTGPTAEELTAFLDGQKDKVSGKIVMVGKHTVIPVNFNPAAKRLDDASGKGEILGQRAAGAAGAAASAGAGAAGRAAEEARRHARSMSDSTPSLSRTRLLIRVNDAAMEQRRIRAFNNRTFDLTKAVPTVIISNEDFGRLEPHPGRRHGGRTRVQHRQPGLSGGKTAYNVIAEIPGSDLKDEVTECLAGTSIRGMRRPERPTTRSAARR
jgi:hypothetical protein